MNTREILSTTRHRPYPLPQHPWMMFQAWHTLLFMHWPISSTVLRPFVPACLEIDTFEGTSWISVVPFHMSDVRLRGCPPIPGFSIFPELNVRTYVVMRGIPGVYFFSLDAGNPVAVALARMFFHLPYFNADMKRRTSGNTIHYASHRTHRHAPLAVYRAKYRPTSPIHKPSPGSLEAWLTERYALYTRAGSYLYRGDIHRLPWLLQQAEAEIETNTMLVSHGFHLSDTPPLLHYAQRQNVLIWPLLRIPIQ